MNKHMTVEQVCTMTESPEFDRKSARIDAKSLAIHLIAFANADGGLIAVGVEDKGQITGIDGYTENINELLRAAFDFCKPSVKIETERLDCINIYGKPDHILLIEVFQSSELHANQADEVFFRVGDKSKKLNFDERVQLMYAKGTRYFEDTPVPDAEFDDIDLDFVKSYTTKIGYRKDPVAYLRENKNFVSTKNGVDEISSAAILLFGKNTMRFFPRARVRFVRYEGTTAKVGAEMNVIKDVVFEGRILQVAEKSLDFVRSQIKEHTYLGADAKFVTEPEYPEFAWKELIVNAIAHRDYSIKGTDIQVKMFDDRLVVESPGTLPGIVRLNNMRRVHFSRNPKIAQFLHEYEYVQEFGEGVDRLYEVMESAGLPQPEYKVESFMLDATLRNKVGEKVGERVGEKVGEIELSENQRMIIKLMKDNPKISAAKIAEHIGISTRKVEENIKKLRVAGKIERSGSARNGQWAIH
jgi:ATP-dependent DNA helicase RecG